MTSRHWLMLVCGLICAGVAVGDEPQRGDDWLRMSPGEKLLMSQGLVGGSQSTVRVLLPRARWAIMQMHPPSADDWRSETVFRHAEEQVDDGRRRSYLRFEPQDLVGHLDVFYAEPRNRIITIADAAHCINQGSVISESIWATRRVQSFRGYENFLRLTREGVRETAPLLHQEGVEVTPGPFGTFERPDGATETYYCLDRFLGAALTNVHEEYERDSWWFSHRVPDYFLKPFEYHPAEKKRREWLADYLSRRDPATGLVPIGRDWEREGIGSEMHLHSWSAGLNLARIYLEWFGDDRELVAQVEEYVRAIVEHHFDPKAKWLYRYVDVRDGKRIGTDYVDIHEFTPTVCLGLLYRITKRKQYREWARELNRIPWEARPFKDTSVTVRGIQMPGAERRYDWDTDCIYWLRSLTKIREWTGDDFYEPLIVGCARDYIAAAWSEEHGHFTSRHMLANGAVSDTRLYGDAYYNSFYLMSHAARISGDSTFMRIWDRQWETFQKLLGISGCLSDLTLQEGKVSPGYGFEMDDNGVFKRQDVLAERHLDAYETTGDAKYLTQATELTDRALAAGPGYWDPQRCFQRFAQVAEARGNVCRVELLLGSPSTRLAISGEPGAMSVEVPTEVAVVYVPKGTYAIRASRGDRQRELSKQVTGPAVVDVWAES